MAVDTGQAYAKGSTACLAQLPLESRPIALRQLSASSITVRTPDLPPYLPPDLPLARRSDVNVRVLPISRVKVTPAPVRETTLARERLLDWLDAHIDRRLITVVADTGYGKTTLIADFCRRTTVRCLWYKLDAADADPLSFLAYVVTAAREFAPDFGAQTVAAVEASLTSGEPWEQALAALIDDLTAFDGQPTALILDDYHLVDEVAEIRTIVATLLRSAPDTFGLVLLTRRRPRLSIGRLVAQGEVGELTTGDLRFSPDEIARLFRDAYRQSIDPDMLAEIDRRTEGWAASLQLVSSTIRGRTPGEARAVIRAMSGAEGPIYDYLAQEVVDALAAPLQRFVVLTSILENVTQDLAAAIFAGESDAPATADLAALMREAYDVGLLTRRSAVETSQRYHPLLRDLLRRRLQHQVSPGALRAMHLRVARVAEHSDWLVACHHFLEADERAEAGRVLSSNADRTLGSGQWGEAAALVRALEVSESDPRIAVIMARDDVYGGRVEQALDRLDQFDLTALSGPERGLVAQARIHALLSVGRLTDVSELAAQVQADPQVPSEYRTIARCTFLTAQTTTRGLLGPAAVALEEAGKMFEAAGQLFFAAIAWHNLLYVQLALGQFSRAVATGEQALERLNAVPGPTNEGCSVLVGVAQSLFELGTFDEAGRRVDEALAEEPAGCSEEYFQAAALLAVMGDRQRAHDLVARASAAPRASTPQSLFAAMVAQARLDLAEGRLEEAAAQLGASYELWPAPVPAAWLTWIQLRAIVDLAQEDTVAARAWIRAGESLSVEQQSWLFLQRFRLIAGLASGEQAAALEAVAGATEATLLSNAEAVVCRVELLQPAPPRLRESISSRTDRWLPLLRRVLQQEPGPRVYAAARLLDEFGDLEDVRPLRALTKKHRKDLKGADLGRDLVHRRSPRLRIADLGRTSFSVGSRNVDLSNLRRKAAATLCFVLTRPGLMATRDQVIEALWPDLDPTSALNSLNQTLYFLRRDIDPAFDDDCSAHYIRFEGELLWLDRQLTDVRSSTFYERASRALASEAPSVQEAQSIVGLYAGRFAPEFEYDDWAIGWRETLHALYLHLAETIGRGLVAQGRLQEAIDVALRVLAIDPAAERFERSLIWLYGTLGARSAAAEQYAHYAAVQRGEYGVEPPTLDGIMAAPLGNPAY